MSVAKKLLCLSGGGMRGLPQAALLAELERRTGKQCCELFDHISGTSIGGIGAALLNAGQPAEDVVNFFVEDGPKIFRKVWWRKGGVLRPRFAAHAIEEVLKEKFSNLRLSHCKSKLLVTSLDLMSQEPFFFKSYDKGTDYFLWQVARATSAAQTYFPAFELDGRILWDGGNVANNPAVCAVADAVSLWPNTPLRVLSIGCGESMAKLKPRRLLNAGLIRAGLASVQMLFETGSEDVDYQLKQSLGTDYLSLQPYFERDISLDDASASGLESLNAAALRFVTECGKTIESFVTP